VVPRSVKYKLKDSGQEEKYHTAEIKYLRIGALHFDVVEHKLAHNKAFKLMERLINGKLKYYKGLIQLSNEMTGYTPGMSVSYGPTGDPVVMVGGANVKSSIGKFVRYYIVKDNKSYLMEKSNFLETLVELTLDCPGIDRYLLKQEHTFEDVPAIIKKYNRECK